MSKSKRRKRPATSAPITVAVDQDGGFAFTASNGTRWCANAVTSPDGERASSAVWWFDSEAGAQKRFAADSSISDAPTLEQLRAMLEAAEAVER